MALDHALAGCLEAGEGVVRLYGWERPTVSFGRNEPAAGLYSLEATGTRGVDYVRRPTGGRAVLHDGELTYSVVAPRNAWGGAREAYLRINEAVAHALRSLGAPVVVSEGGRVLHPGGGPCFQSPAPGEVVARGRKLVGSAQARLEGAMLQHGSILMGGDQAILSDLVPGSPQHEAPATLRELIGDVSIDEVAEAVAMSLRGRFGGTWTPGGYRHSELRMAEGLEAERYARDSWTWRR